MLSLQSSPAASANMSTETKEGMGMAQIWAAKSWVVKHAKMRLNNVWAVPKSEVQSTRLVQQSEKVWKNSEKNPAFTASKLILDLLIRNPQRKYCITYEFPNWYMSWDSSKNTLNKPMFLFTMERFLKWRQKKTCYSYRIPSSRVHLMHQQDQVRVRPKKVIFIRGFP